MPRFRPARFAVTTLLAALALPVAAAECPPSGLTPGNHAAYVKRIQEELPRHGFRAGPATGQMDDTLIFISSDNGPEMETCDRCLRAKGQTSEFCSGVPAYGVGFTASLEHLAQEARALHPYQIEIANRIRGGRAVGTDYVVTRRPLGQTAILTRLPSRDKAVAWIRARGGG